MQRHPYEWPSLAENQWPNHGRKLTRGELRWKHDEFSPVAMMVQDARAVEDACPKAGLCG